jgi:hypothetical protein
MSKGCHLKRFFRRFRRTTNQSETSFKSRVATVDSVDNIDLFNSSSQNTPTHVLSHSGFEHVRTEQTVVQKAEPQENLSRTSTDSQSSAPKHHKRKIASAILKKTITIAANIAQNVAMVPGAQVAGELVIVIIEKFDVSGANLFVSFPC